MVYRVKLTPAAQQDLDDIRLFLGSDYPESIKRVFTELAERMAMLPDFPLAGAPCREFSSERIREIVYSHYRIIYSPYADRQIIYILRVWHGARGTPKLPRNRVPQ